MSAITSPYSPKQPSESYPIGVDFSNVLDSDIPEIIENPTDITFTALDNTEADATADILIEISKQVKDDTEAVIKIKDGTEALSPYKITCKIVTSEDNEYENDQLLYVKDK